MDKTFNLTSALGATLKSAGAHVEPAAKHAATKPPSPHYPMATATQSIHPGLQTGALNKTVKDCMSKRLECCNDTDNLRTAATKMKSANVGCLGVMSGGNLVGMITDRDIVTRCLAEGKDYNSCKVSDCMTRDVLTISPAESMRTFASAFPRSRTPCVLHIHTEKAHDLMCQRNIRRLIVGDKGSNNFGLISKSDFMIGNKA